MKEIYAYYAKCNKQINSQMNDVLHKHIGNPFNFELKGYFFKSLGLLLEHIYISDMNWMKEYLAISDHGMNIESEVGSIPEYGKQVFNTYEGYYEQRNKLDDFIIKYMDKIDEYDLRKSVSRKTRNGELLERELWKAIIHFFNHQTHHRGQISNIMDEQNIENNYSNMIYIE